jgi:predicted phage tail protein
MLREIRVYGRLAKFLKRRVFRAEIASVAEAVRFLLANFPELEQHMADQHYRVSLNGRSLALDEIHEPSGQQVIKIVPVLAGAGGGTGQILAGIGLIAAAIITGGILSAGVTLGGFMGIGTIGTVVVGIGASLVLGGVAQLLTPVPQVIAPGTGASNTEKDPRKSYSFSGIQNTSRQGLPVPIVYGETLVGSVVISAGIDTVQVVG